VSSLEPFNPAIDRYDQRSAARLFQSLWPDENVARAVAGCMTASVRVAHAAGDACWEVTMYSYGVRLNVGQVEALTMLEGDARFLVRAPLHLTADPRFKIDTSQSPVYPAVPVPSGVCKCAGTPRRCRELYFPLPPGPMAWTA
jgi:5-methylcytosine-specific restriction protein A